MTYTGRDVRRLEDADLLRGAGRFADDLPMRRIPMIKKFTLGCCRILFK